MEILIQMKLMLQHKPEPENSLRHLRSQCISSSEVMLLDLLKNPVFLYLQVPLIQFFSCCCQISQVELSDEHCLSSSIGFFFFNLPIRWSPHTDIQKEKCKVQELQCSVQRIPKHCQKELFSSGKESSSKESPPEKVCPSIWALSGLGGRF